MIGSNAPLIDLSKADPLPPLTDDPNPLETIGRESNPLLPIILDELDVDEEEPPPPPKDPMGLIPPLDRPYCRSCCGCSERLPVEKSKALPPLMRLELELRPPGERSPPPPLPEPFPKPPKLL